MIKAHGEMDGKPMLLLGLSGENLTRLAAGEPITFDGEPLGYPGHVVIVYGRTEDEILAQLRSNGVLARHH